MWKQMLCFLSYAISLFVVVDISLGVYFDHFLLTETVALRVSSICVSVLRFLSLAPYADWYSCCAGSLSPRAQRVQYLLSTVGRGRKWKQQSNNRNIRDEKSWNSLISSVFLWLLIISMRIQGCLNPVLFSIWNMRLLACNKRTTIGNTVFKLYSHCKSSVHTSLLYTIYTNSIVSPLFYITASIMCFSSVIQALYTTYFQYRNGTWDWVIHLQSYIYYYDYKQRMYVDVDLWMHYFLEYVPLLYCVITNVHIFKKPALVVMSALCL